MNKRIWIAVVLLLLAVLALLSWPGARQLTIESSSWGGWGPQPSAVTQPTVSSSDLPGTRILLPAGSGAFTVFWRDPWGLLVWSDEPLATVSDSGGIDLNSSGALFRVPVDRPLELATPSMDGGTRYTLTLSR